MNFCQDRRDIEIFPWKANLLGHLPQSKWWSVRLKSLFSSSDGSWGNIVKLEESIIRATTVCLCLPLGFNVQNSLKETVFQEECLSGWAKAPESPDRMLKPGWKTKAPLQPLNKLLLQEPVVNPFIHLPCLPPWWDAWIHTVMAQRPGHNEPPSLPKRST